MKRVICLLMLLVFLSSVNAQFFQYNSINILNYEKMNKEQLDLALTKVNKNIKIGQTMTGIGIGAVIIGGVIYGAGINSLSSGSMGGYAPAISGSLLLYGGIITAGIGIPVWMINDDKKNNIEVSLVKYSGTSQIGIRIKF